VDGDAVRMVAERLEQQRERLRCCGGGREVARQRQPRPPVARLPGDQPLAELDEPGRRAEPLVRALEAIEGEVRAVRLGLGELFPLADGRRPGRPGVRTRRPGSDRPGR
jgi:hypothetical protein